MSSAQAAIADAIEQEDAFTDQFLTFILAGEEYGVDILRVQEIRGWSAVTRMPNTPEYIQGILNLRGTIVPIIDLRLRFGIEKIDYGPTTVIVVLKAQSCDQTRTVGLVVDGVSDVCNVQREEFKEAPDFGASVRLDFVKGMAAIQDKMVILLDVDSLLNNDDLAMLDGGADLRRGGMSEKTTSSQMRGEH